jgi:hypothetical protein
MVVSGHHVSSLRWALLICHFIVASIGDLQVHCGSETIIPGHHRLDLFLEHFSHNRIFCIHPDRFCLFGCFISLLSTSYLIFGSLLPLPVSAVAAASTVLFLFCRMTLILASTRRSTLASERSSLDSVLPVATSVEKATKPLAGASGKVLGVRERLSGLGIP